MLWNDPDRWVDADMQRNEWVKFGCLIFLLSAVFTITVIVAGIIWR